MFNIEKDDVPENVKEKYIDVKQELKNYLKSQKTVKPVAQNWYTRNNCYLHFVRESGTRPYFPLFFIIIIFKYFWKPARCPE